MKLPFLHAGLPLIIIELLDMANRNLVIITRVILIYSFFFMAIKAFAIFKGAWLEANLILCLPFLLLAAVGLYLNKSKRYSWIYVVLGILVIGLVRYFERDWAVAIQAAVT